MCTDPPGLTLPSYPDDPPPEHVCYGPRLPMDLWSDIVSHLSVANLEHATLVCRYFRQLAQPLLFRTLVVKPFAFNPKKKKTSPRPPGYQKWICMKLAFYSTPRIARSVKTCAIGPRALFHEGSGSEESPEDPGRAIIDDVFEVLTQFQGLTNITVTMVVITNDNLAQLSRLLSCSSLTLMHCRSSAAVPSHLAVKNFIFRNDSQNWAVIEDGLHILLSSVVNPDRIESFTLVGRAALAMLPYLPHNAFFPKLHTLCVDYAIICSPALQSFISKCIALEEIHIPSSDRMNGAFMRQPIGPSDLSKLKVYHGPDLHAENFIADRPVLHVRLWSDVWEGSRDADELMPYLKGLRSSSELESLEFSVKRITKGLLGEICLLFPHLRALSIVVDSMEHKTYGVYTREVRWTVHLCMHLLICILQGVNGRVILSVSVAHD